MKSIPRLKLLKSWSLGPWLVTLLAILIIVYAKSASHRSLARPDFLTGYTLAATCLLLTLLGIRKRLIVLPLGKVSIWARAHNYIGVFGVAMLVLHVRWPIQGLIEQALALVFMVISASGLLGWYINRTTPKKLLVTGQDVLYDDIPRHQQRVAERAFALAIAVAAKLESATLAEYYSHKLASFFQKQRSLAYAMVPSGKARRQHLDHLAQLDRYLDAEGRLARSQMCELIQAKDDLDFAKAMQQRLRYWVVVHRSLIWLFILLAFAHIWMAHRFHGT